jgi:hypothetical protein
MATVGVVRCNTMLGWAYIEEHFKQFIVFLLLSEQMIIDFNLLELIMDIGLVGVDLERHFILLLQNLLPVNTP